MRIYSLLKNSLYRYFPFLDRYHTLKQFIKFSLVGVTNVIIDFTTYYFLTRVFNIYFVIANIGAFTVAVTWSFYINKNWTFRKKEGNAHWQYIKFFAINFTGIIIQTSLLYFLVTSMGMFDIHAKMVAIVITAFWNFFNSKLLAFR